MKPKKHIARQFDLIEPPFNLVGETLPEPVAKPTPEPTVSRYYADACKAHCAAARLFAVSERAYRAQEIGDEEYCAAARVFKTATAIFDAAFEAESNRMPPRVDDEPEWNRGQLFPDFVPFKEDYLLD